MVPKLSPQVEKAIALAFVNSVPRTGRVPARKPYEQHRDEEFIKNWKISATATSISRPGHPCFNAESVIEAIYVGLRAGYSEADIAAYICRNYAIDDKPFKRE